MKKLILLLLAGELLASGLLGQEIVGGRWKRIRLQIGNGLLFGISVAGVEDLNGDGFDDYLVGSVPDGRIRVSVFSGKSGRRLGVFHGEPPLPFDIHDLHRPLFAMTGLGDLDGDGFGDFALGNARLNKVVVLSGRTGGKLYQVSGPNGGIWFGFSLAKMSDLDGDQVPDFLVGAPRARPGRILAGSVFLYSGATGTLLSRFDGKTKEGLFGWSVSDAKDVDGDGIHDLVIGVPGADPMGLVDAGFTVVLSGADGSRILRIPGRQESSSQGFSVAGIGDANGDGLSDLLVGAPYFHAAPQAHGEADLYSGASGKLIWKGYQVTELSDSKFGFAVAATGDLDGDGLADWMAAGPESGSYGSGIFSGGVQIGFGPSGNFLHRMGGYKDNQQFGFSIATAGDLNGDGYQDLLFGIPGHILTGAVAIWTFQPFLKTDPLSLSASAGATLHLKLDFPHSAGGQNFTVLASLHGTGPTVLWGVDIPLTPDFLYDRLLAGNPPSPFLGNHGNLDAFGMGAVTFTFPAGALAPALGRNLSVAAIAAPGPGFVSFTSVAHKIRILP